jgi:hypothetical protein
VVSFMPWSFLPLGKEPLIPIGQQAAWTPEPVWIQWTRENLLSLPGIKSCFLGYPLSLSLYEVSCPSSNHCSWKNVTCQCVYVNTLRSA